MTNWLKMFYKFVNYDIIKLNKTFSLLNNKRNSINKGDDDMVSILTSVTMISISTYFMMAILFLVTEKWGSLKNGVVISSFVCWALGGLAFLYTSSYASLHGLMGISAIVEAVLSVTALLLLGKVYFIGSKNRQTSY